MFYLEETYGNDGFAVFVKLLRELAKADYHYLNLSKTTTLMFLSAKCKVSKETLEAIINDLVDLEKFDSELWNENKIIFCQDFIDSIQDAYSKRLNKCIDRKSLILLLQAKGIRKQDKSNPKPLKSSSEGVGNTQSIVEYIKEKKTNNNIDFDLFLKWFNITTGKNLRVVTKKAKDNIKARLKEGFFKEDLQAAVINCFNDDYHKSNNHKYLTPEFISRSDKMEKFCSVKPQKKETHNISIAHSNYVD